MADPDFVKIIHQETGNVADVPRSSLTQHYSAGWTLLDESPEPDPVPAPPPVRASKKAAASAAGSGADGATTEGQ
jgi:hypothetical protein